MNEPTTVNCPYCGEPFDIEIDDSAGASQQFTSDCEVCCRPIRFAVTIASDGAAEVQVHTEAGD